MTDKNISQILLSFLILQNQNNTQRFRNMHNKHEREQYRNKMKEVVTILLESSFYLTMPLEERHSLIKIIIERYQFQSNKSSQ